MNLNQTDRLELERWVAAHRPPQQVSQRCQILLGLAENWLAKVTARARPNQIWVSDITYLPTRERWMPAAAKWWVGARMTTWKLVW